jgi:hypothetical protein
MLVTLQKMHAIFILRHAIITVEGSFRLTMLSSFLSLSFFDMLLGTNGNFLT